MTCPVILLHFELQRKVSEKAQTAELLVMYRLLIDLKFQLNKRVYQVEYMSDMINTNSKNHAIITHVNNWQVFP